MKGRLFTILSAVSLLLCVAVVVLWVASKMSSVAIRTQLPPLHGKQRWIAVSDGWLVYGENADWPDVSDLNWGKTYRWRCFGLGKGGTSFRSWRNDLNASSGAYVRWREAHLWLLAVAFAFIPICLVTRRRCRSQSWRDCGLCSACGYDLRATPERCPECGWVAERTTG